MYGHIYVQILNGPDIELSVTVCRYSISGLDIKYSLAFDRISNIRPDARLDHFIIKKIFSLLKNFSRLAVRISNIQL
jgi:hypothetical protein